MIAWTAGASATVALRITGSTGIKRLSKLGSRCLSLLPFKELFFQGVDRIVIESEPCLRGIVKAPCKRPVSGLPVSPIAKPLTDVGDCGQQKHGKHNTRRDFDDEYHGPPSLVDDDGTNLTLADHCCRKSIALTFRSAR
jgi:hypothetical protein